MQLRFLKVKTLFYGCLYIYLQMGSTTFKCYKIPHVTDFKDRYLCHYVELCRLYVPTPCIVRAYIIYYTHIEESFFSTPKNDICYRCVTRHV